MVSMEIRRMLTLDEVLASLEKDDFSVGDLTLERLAEEKANPPTDRKAIIKSSLLLFFNSALFFL